MIIGVPREIKGGETRVSMTPSLCRRLTGLGAAVIVASGLYALYRERIRGYGRPAAASAAPGMAVDGL